MPNAPASPPPTLFCLHFLGGSAREWEDVVRHLGSHMRGAPLDLPGFGNAAGIPYLSVEGMADYITDRIAAMAPPRWLIAGHSMGAKVALAIARRAEDGDFKLKGFEGLVLLAGSPPSPEPMSDDKRRDMMAWISADEDTRVREAGKFIDQNIGAPLSPSAKAEAVADVLRANAHAWAAWLETGSREDWCQRIGVLQSPALVLSGSEDADLGFAAQACLMLPHLANARHAMIEGAGHLLPIECPKIVADFICEMLALPVEEASDGGRIAEPYGALIASHRVNSRLRAALHARAASVGRAYRPSVLDAVELSILRALIARILPQEADSRLDIGARIDARLADGAGDGWRFAELPPDAEAYAAALRTVDAAARAAHDVGFVALADETKDALIAALTASQLPTTEGLLDGSQMAKWFEDLRSDAVRIYLAHPAALARIGFSGIGVGGDDVSDLPGFSELRIGACEPWEPVAEMEIVR
jgi:pimeloyl-ACP methyl ester carboxylesterase